MVIARRVSSSCSGGAVFGLVGMYGVAYVLLSVADAVVVVVVVELAVVVIVVVVVLVAAAIVEEEVTLCAGFGFAGMGAFKFAAFIHAYRPPNPAACVATTFDVFFRTSSDIFRAVTPGPSFLRFFFAPPLLSSPDPAPNAAPAAFVWAAKAAAWAAANSARSFRSCLILVSSSLSAFSIAASCFATSEQTTMDRCRCTKRQGGRFV